MRHINFRAFVNKALSVIPAAAAIIAIGHCAGAEMEQRLKKGDFRFTNVVDTAQDRNFLLFGEMPAINNAGSVAFTAFGTSFPGGAVFEWEHDRTTTIASSADGVIANIGIADINASGTVAFSATLANSNGNAMIATGKGGKLDIAANAADLGLFGRFLSLGGINNSGTVVFLGTRLGFASQAIFAGGGGPVTTLIDTNTSTFGALGNADINDSGTVVFRGFLPDGSQGVFTGPNGSTVIADTHNPQFSAFLDPVINDSGAIGSAAFLNGGGALIFTSKQGRLTPRNNPTSPLFVSVDNVSINNSGDVAFSGDLPGGQRTIYIETTGRDSIVPVIATGDALFGSTVTALSLGTHSLNGPGHISFRYFLADGRSGIAVAYPAGGYK